MEQATALPNNTLMTYNWRPKKVWSWANSLAIYFKKTQSITLVHIAIAVWGISIHTSHNVYKD